MGGEVVINGRIVRVDEGERLRDLKRRGLVPANHQVMVRGPNGVRLIRDDDVIDPEEGDFFTTPPWRYGRPHGDEAEDCS
jgi:hypothetical protein